jgi:tRNA A-37 threonylcarbamoyl transferase component Bud32
MLAMKQCPTCGVRFHDGSTLCPIDASLLVELPDPLIGRVIQERYLVEELIGSGGMGSVYRGRHQVIQRSVALKFLSSKHAKDESSRQRFLREARAVNRAQHEHIIDVSDFGETDDGLVYMVMELLSGRTLSQDIAQGPLPLVRACSIGLQLVLALARAHELGVIHRDIKPANVFLLRRAADYDFVKLLDFGLARANDDVALTKSNLLFGTPEYMAPEQASSGPIGAKADLYAFGCVLFEMTTGRLPFEGAPTGLIYKHVYEPPPRPTTLRPDMPIALEQLVLRLLNKAPERRPASAYEVADELARIAASLPAAAQPVPLPIRPNAASDDGSRSEARHEEDLWQDNLQALQTRIAARYGAAPPPAGIRAALQRLAALIGDAHAARRDLGLIHASSAEHHDAIRSNKLRIGAAIDALALDEARVAQDIAGIAIAQELARRELDAEARRFLSTLEAGPQPHMDASSSPAASAWARAQAEVFALQDRLSEREVMRADLRFQISHLKERLGSLEAEVSAELAPVEAQAGLLKAQLGTNLSAIRNEAERITESLDQPPPS